MNHSTGAAFVGPFSRTVGHMQILQWKPLCKDIQYNTADCLEAYGFQRGEEKCKDLISDLYECIHNTKQNIRRELMRIEFERQVKEGKREYLPPPNMFYNKH